MNISAPFIRRPIATSLLAIAILLAGSAAFTQLPVSPLPPVDFPTISVSAALPGASPTTMATAVAMPLERRFGRIAGVSEITSSSSLGTTSVTVQFDLDRNVESAARDIQAAINAAGGDLPPNLPTRPNYRKVNPADAPILIISLRSKTLPLPQVFEAANTVLAQKISQVPGVGQVGVGGGVQPAVRIRVDPVALAGYGIGLEDVRNALANATADQPEGVVGKDQFQTISMDDQLVTADQWKNVIVHYAQATDTLDPGAGNSTLLLGSTTVATDINAVGGAGGVIADTSTAAVVTIAQQGLTAGLTAATSAQANIGQGAVRLGDIADVFNDVENRLVAGWYDGQRTVMVIIRRQPGANIIDVIDRVEALLPELKLSISPTIDMDVAVDRAGTIRASVHDVERTLVISILLVVAVVFLFLRSPRATLIPSVAVPLSLIATFGVMYVLGFNLDNLSLMALTIATGFVVDDAIVVTENVTRHIEAGVSPRKAALIGAKEIGFTIVSITVSLLAVFIPLLFMAGQLGRLFREFSVTLAVSITVSAIISLTLTPMMCSRLLKGHEGTEPGWSRALERFFEWLNRGYARSLKFVLRHSIPTFLVWIGTVVLTFWLFGKIPFDAFPQQDTGMIQGQSFGPQDISFPAMKERQEKVQAIVSADKDVDHVVGSIGGFGSTTGNTGSLFISLKDREKRDSDATAIIARLRPQLAKVEGIDLKLQAVQDVRVGGRAASGQYQYTLSDANLDELSQWAPKVEAALKKLPNLRDVRSDQQTGGLELDVTIDRDNAARFGITVATVDNVLYDAFGQRQIATTYTQINQYHVVMEASPSIGAGPEALDRIWVGSPTGAQIPLSMIAHVAENHVPLAVTHQSQFPCVTISFNGGEGVALSDAIAAVNQVVAKLGMPASIRGSFAGTAQAAQASFQGFGQLFGLAFLSIYIVLGMLYESYVHPLTIISTVFSAGVGAMLALWLTGTSMSLIAIVGLILLIGIVKKNAILIVDFALEKEREEKLSPKEAIFEASRIRFRPILMTTMAALLGAVPLAIGNGTGSELRRPLGIAIVGGLLLSQLLTLYTTPVIYYGLANLKAIFGRSKAATRALVNVFLPGVGQILNDETDKGTLLLVIGVIARLAYFGVLPMPKQIAGVIVLVTWLYAIVDAAIVGRRRDRDARLGAAPVSPPPA